jgi:hypothetical protein
MYFIICSLLSNAQDQAVGSDFERNAYSSRFCACFWAELINNDVGKTQAHANHKAFGFLKATG